MSKLIIFTAVLMIAMTTGRAEATFLPSPALSCSPKDALDAGYSFVIAEDGGGPTYVGELSEISLRGSRSLGSENVVMKNIGTGETCDIEITQQHDKDGNELRLVIRDVTKSVIPEAVLSLKINGRSIAQSLKTLTCQIDQILTNKVCKQKIGGAIYESQMTKEPLK